MNKLPFVLLAISFVCVHAFVKRDAPEAPSTEKYLDTIEKQFKGLAEDFNNKVKGAFDPEVLKKGLADILENLNKAVDSMKPKDDTPK